MYGRLLPGLTGCTSDMSLRYKWMREGRAFGGVQFTFDKWTDFDMPAEHLGKDRRGQPVDNPAYKSIMQGVENGHLEITDKKPLKD